jgi:hypothetical protein
LFSISVALAREVPVLLGSQEMSKGVICFVVLTARPLPQGTRSLEARCQARCLAVNWYFAITQTPKRFTSYIVFN